MSALHGCIGRLGLLHQHHRQRLADERRATDDHNVLAGRLIAAVLQQQLHGGGRCRQKVAVAAQQPAEALRRQAVHVFGGRDGCRRRELAQAIGQRHLHNDAVEARVEVEIGDHVQQPVERNLRRRPDRLGVDADLVAAARLAAHVRLRACVMPN
jgi:hypothetical protein